MKTLLGWLLLMLCAFVGGCEAGEGAESLQAASSTAPPPTVTVFAAAPSTIAKGSPTELVFAATAGAKLSIDQGVGDVTRLTSFTVRPLVDTTYTLTATLNGKTVKRNARVHVVCELMSKFTLSFAGSSMVAGNSTKVTVTAVTTSGAVAQDFVGHVELASDDPSATLPAAYAFSESEHGQHVFDVTFKTSGERSLEVAAVGSGITGDASVRVLAGRATTLALSGVGNGARLGQSQSLAVEARDEYGNVADGYRGTVAIDPGDSLATHDPAHVYDAADGGRHTFNLSFGGVGSFSVTASDGSLSSSVGVEVRGGLAASVRLAGLPKTTTAGEMVEVSVSVIDAAGNEVGDYAGTLAFANSDGAARATPPLTLTTSDHGHGVIDVSFHTAGAQTLEVSDNSIHGFGQTIVLGGVAASCSITGFSAPWVAGTVQAPRVAWLDAFGNVATNYTGLVSLSSGDARAKLGPAAVYDAAADRGVRDFSAALVSAGTQTLTASDSILTCSTDVVVTPGAARFVVSLPADVNAGEAANGSVSVVDDFGNPLLGYAGTVTFSCSDTLAVLPGSVVFSGAEAGTLAIVATFGTRGAQSLAATDGATSSSAAVNVHGLVYTNPTNEADVRLVLNAAASNGRSIRLDAVAGRTVRGAFAIGMNLPVDSHRAVADAPLLVAGTALSVTGALPAVAAALPTSGPAADLLLVAVSQKAAGVGAVPTNRTVQFGSTYFSVRLKLAVGAPLGIVFDGTALGSAWRAAVLDRQGNDTVSLSKFSIGRLEVL